MWPVFTTFRLVLDKRLLLFEFLVKSITIASYIFSTQRLFSTTKILSRMRQTETTLRAYTRKLSMNTKRAKTHGTANSVE